LGRDQGLQNPIENGANMKKPDMHAQMRRELKDKSLLEQARQYAFDYIDGVAERAVFPDAAALQNLDRFDDPLPDHPQSGADVLALLNDCGAPATVAQTGGRYFGFVNGGVVPTALAARWMADAWDQNPALYVISPVVGKLEQVCEGWLRDLLELPDGTVAGYVSGSSTATMCGLAAARCELLKRQGWDVNAQGLFGAPPIRVIVSEQAHSSVFKALALLGLGKDRIERIPADDQGRIDASRIPDLDACSLLILQAGNVNTGAFDAFARICDPTRKNGAWVHVDGAFGLWARASDKRTSLVNGVELADSWSADGHKTLNTPYDCGIVLCRQRDVLVAAMQASGAYIQYSHNRDPMMHVPEMSRRARAVDLWATLKYLGRSGVGKMIDGMCDRATQFADRLAAQDFRILNEVVFNQVLVAGETPSQTLETLAGIQASGVCWCGGTEWNGDPAIRISVSSWVTTPGDVQRSVDAFVAARSNARSSSTIPGRSGR
jgi:glutamate/tyrosine decarboxylase-like PLP-dependent enzyme